MSPDSTNPDGVVVVLNARSACPAVATRSVAVALLFPAFGSFAAPTVAVSVMTVPATTPTFTFTCSWKLPVLPAATLGLVQVTLPVPPTTGVEQLHPAGNAKAWNVVLAGTVSRYVAVVAAADPVFVTTCV